MVYVMEANNTVEYSEMADTELQNEHDQLLRLQEQDFAAGNAEGAKALARERNKIWKVAQKRGVSL